MSARPGQVRLGMRPGSLRGCNALVAELHRHHKPVRGCKFSAFVVTLDGRKVGAMIAGRPVSRMFDPDEVIEITRCVTDGTPNACSIGYAAVCRAAKAIGYRKAITYTLASEPGTSLKAAGFTREAETRGGSWDRPSRGRVDKAPIEPKVRWGRTL